MDSGFNKEAGITSSSCGSSFKSSVSFKGISCKFSREKSKIFSGRNIRLVLSNSGFAEVALLSVSLVNSALG